MKKLICGLLLYGACFDSQANQVIDSLQNVLKNSREDTTKVNTLNRLSFAYWGQSKYDSSLSYALNAKSLAESLKYKRGIATAINNCGLAYWRMGKVNEAMQELQVALKMRRESGDKAGIADVLSYIGSIYFDRESYPEAMSFQLDALKIREELNDKKGIATVYNSIGSIYSLQGNFTEALQAFTTSMKIRQEIGDKRGLASSYHGMGIILVHQGRLEEALQAYFNSLKIKEEINDKRGIANSRNNIGDIYEKQGKLLMAKREYEEVLPLRKEVNDKVGEDGCYINLAGVYAKLGNYAKARKYLDDAWKLSFAIESKYMISQTCNMMAFVDSITGKWRDAYIHQKMYTAYRDSVVNDSNTRQTVELKMKYLFEKKEALTKAEHEKKEALAASEISKQKIIRNSIAGGTGLLLVSSVFSFLFYKRKKEAAFQTEVSEVEMKALRAQMNPHFIFNSLNSIKLYMSANDKATAEDYLTKFATVMRLILENSEHKEVALQDDLKVLELYMQLESLRAKKKFNYEIRVHESIDVENTLIPPLILQPFVENSIWHGLADKDSGGKIIIGINRNGEMIECSVEDNGIGREKSRAKAGHANVERKSLGMKITKSRIDILNRIKKSKAAVELIDLAEGMKVIVKLPLEMSF